MQLVIHDECLDSIVFLGCVLFAWCPYMVIDIVISAQYNGGLLPDIMLLNPMREEFLFLQLRGLCAPRTLAAYVLCYESLERFIGISHKHWNHSKIMGDNSAIIPLDIRNGVILTSKG